MNESDLNQLGFVRQKDGSYTKMGPGGVLGRMVPARTERSPVQALDGGGTERCQREAGVEFIVTLVSFRTGTLDSDSLPYSLKPLRDAVSRSLGLDDADGRIEWRYSQVRAPDQTGTLVKIMLHSNQP